MHKLTPKELLTFDECPRKWALSRSAKRQRRNLNLAQMIGVFYHQAIKKHIELGTPAYEHFLEYVSGQDLFGFNGHDDNTAEILSAASALLPKFENDFASLGLKPAMNETTVQYIAGEWYLTGSPDAIMLDTLNNIVIVDYKITSHPVHHTFPFTSDQLHAYALGLSQSLGDSSYCTLVVNLITSTREVLMLHGKCSERGIKEYCKKVDFVYNQMQGHNHFKRSMRHFDSPCPFCEMSDACIQEDMQSNKLVDILGELEDLYT